MQAGAREEGEEEIAYTENILSQPRSSDSKGPNEDPGTSVLRCEVTYVKEQKDPKERPKGPRTSAWCNRST